MNDREWLAERFEERRPRLRAVAYRMLGSLSDAEDAVQEAWLRVSGTAYGQIDDLGAWLTPLVYVAIVIVSWALRPADRRLSNPGLAPETGPLAWAVPIGILLLLYVIAYLTLPAVNIAMHKRAHDLGWIAR